MGLGVKRDPLTDQTKWFDFTDREPKTLRSGCPEATGLVKPISHRLVLEASSPPTESHRLSQHQATNPQKGEGVSQLLSLPSSFSF